MIPSTPTQPTPPPMRLESLRERLQRLGLYGLRAQVDTLASEPWLERLLAIEEAERQNRSLARRLRNARLGAFKPLADFDWHWPSTCNRPLIEELFTLEFLCEATNVVLIGPNGLGKTLLAKTSPIRPCSPATAPASRSPPTCCTTSPRRTPP